MDETVQGAMEAEDESTTGGPGSGPVPLATLWERYASGETDESEFEPRLERLVATEDIPPGAVSDVEPGDSVRDAGSDTTPGTETGDGASNDREPARER